MMLENLSFALLSLKVNKMRTMLTMLGIIIGIMSIISIITLGDAMTSSVIYEISAFGVNNVYVAVQEKGLNTDEMALLMGGLSALTSDSGKMPSSEDLISDKMVEDLKASFPNQISGVSIVEEGGTAQSRVGDLYANINIFGVNADFIVAENITMLSGKFISESDLKNIGQVAVVSDKFISNMFPSVSDPIGQTVQIYRPNVIEAYTIIGVYRHETPDFVSTVADRDISTDMFIPITRAKQDMLEKNYIFITVISSDSRGVDNLRDSLQRHFDRLYANNRDWKASAFSMTSMLEIVNNLMGILSLALAVIAGISLLVGGIGVMNIMLVSVTERTREIGIRKALGAMNYHIQLQFVTEAVIIVTIGGIIGLSLGIAIGATITSIFEVPLVISPFTAIGSVLFSMLVGVFFGIYPANKAAKMDPIDALRYE